VGILAPPCKQISEGVFTMELKSNLKCKIQQILLETKCPGCFSKEINLRECECDEDNVACKSCGCTFKLNPEAVEGKWFE
jgi:hypothetical protein